jgi:histidinol dehydrogenase
MTPIRRIDGFQAARQALSREVPQLADIPVSERLSQSLKDNFDTPSPMEAVTQIVTAVREQGDLILRELTQLVDGVTLTDIEVSPDAVKAAYAEVDDELLAAMKLAAARVREFYTRQKALIWDAAIKSNSGQLVRVLERVGIYVPGGTAAYPSTVLMTAIPAQVAGVPEIVMVTPPKPGGGVPAATLVAADLAGVKRIFSIGGAQAIAALAYGTDSVPKVDKIVGPGNIFVMLAKKQVYGVVDIEGLAGPSEVLIVADETTDPAACAADILAQAEHDALAQSVLVATSGEVADAVAGEIARQIADLPRWETINASLTARGLMVTVANIKEALTLANLYAPEHLILMVADAAKHLPEVRHAGCVFIGDYVSVAFGDYVAGPSHVLPTGGTARFSSPLNVGDFMKLVDVVDVDAAAARELGAAAIRLARAEGLEAHARAVEIRLRSLE